MGKWGTHDVNLCPELIRSMKKKGCIFCYIRDNQKNIDKFNKNKDENTDENTDENKDLIFDFTTDNGDKITGLVIHLVMGSTYGCRETDWFIVKPVAINEVVVEDL